MNVPFLQTATFTGLVSTDEYRTSYEWNEAYNISQNVFTNVQSNSANWNTAYNIATFYAQNSAILVEQTTFSQLTGLKATNQLKPGQLYVITDFELKWIGMGLYDPEPYKSSGVIEPLIVRALSSNKLDVEAYSVLHPQDIVYYDIDATNSYTWTDGGPRPASPPIPNFKGWITRRVDRVKNIDIGWDWRYIKTNCCKFNIDPLPLYNASTTYNRFDVVRTSGGKIYYSIENNNTNNGFSASWWLPVFGETTVVRDEYFPTLERGTGIGAPLFTIYPILSTRTQLPTVPSTLNNITIKSGFNNLFTTGGLANIDIGYSCNNNHVSFMQSFTIKDGFQNNILYGFNENCTIGISFANNIINGSLLGVYPRGIYFCTFGNSITNNIINHAFFYNTVGNSMSNSVFASFINNNKFDDNFSNNRIGRFFTFNNIGHSFQNNAINSNFSFNDIEDSFLNNTTNQNFNYNTIDDGCQFNTFGQTFRYNIIENDCLYNTFGTNAEYNSIGNTFANNTIGAFFRANIIQNGFETNIIGNNFNSNTIRNNLFGINFTGATHVYNNYDTTLFRNQNSVYRLSYYNSTDQLVVTDPTA